MKHQNDVPREKAQTRFGGVKIGNVHETYCCSLSASDLFFMKTKSRSLSVVLALLALCTLNSPLSTAQAQVTAFSYSGQLNYAPPPGNISAPANGTYNLQFTLYNNSAGTGTMGNGMLAQASYPGVVINNGLFTQTVDFGTPSPFNGQSCWLQIGVEGPSDTGFQQQTPLQQVLPAPYAMYRGECPERDDRDDRRHGQYRGGGEHHRAAACDQWSEPDQFDRRKSHGAAACD